MGQDTYLKRGQKVRLLDNRTVTVKGELGRGGQGIVYLVQVDGTGEKKALKWYYIDKVTEPEKFRENLGRNIERGAPSPAFVWPEQLTEWVNGSFGYLQRVYPKEYREFSKYLLAREKFGSTAAVVDAALGIVTAFMKLHDAGFNYQDLNDGNFAFHPKTGEVLICDNDNVMGHGYYSGVLGKARYMAPEVVRGETRPNKVTDRFSLAVILFLLLVGDHPLEGALTNVPVLTNKYEKRFFGEKPLFMFDEYDTSNMPIQGKHRNAINLWPYYPAYIQDAFRRSFSQKSLLKAEGRLLEKEWFHLLVRLKSSIVRCPHCGEEIFLEDAEKTMCPECRKWIRPTAFFESAHRRANVVVRVPVFEDVTMFAYHMSENSEDYRTEAARVIVKPGKTGLKNMSGQNWTVRSAGKSGVRGPGDIVVLGDGMQIDFGGGSAMVIVQT